jgi:prevent-host-death family protein
MRSNSGIREIPISKFKATCLSVLKEVGRTRKPVRVTRFGKPVAEIVPPAKTLANSWFGCMKGEMEIVGDIVGPIGAFDNWRPKSDKFKL